jgi:hypothetical protein
VPEWRAARLFARARRTSRPGVQQYARQAVAAMRADPEYLDPFLNFLYGLFQGWCRPRGGGHAAVDELPDAGVQACLRSLRWHGTGYCEPTAFHSRSETPATCQLVFGFYT